MTEQGSLKRLLDPNLTYRDPDGVEWIAPQGTLTDGASVPRIALPITNGRWDSTFLKAAVLHDAYCQTDNQSVAPNQYRTRPWQDTHRMFYNAMLAAGTDSLLAKIMFAAVWLGGPRWGVDKQDSDTAPDEALTRAFSSTIPWIEQANPTVDDIEKDLNLLRPVAVELYQLEAAIESSIGAGEDDQAGSLLLQQRQLIDELPPALRSGSMMQIYDGHWYKNRAVLDLRLNNQSEASLNLQRANQEFTSAAEVNPSLPSLRLGQAQVATLAGQPERAQLLMDQSEQLSRNIEESVRELNSSSRDQ